MPGTESVALAEGNTRNEGDPKSLCRTNYELPRIQHQSDCASSPVLTSFFSSPTSISPLPAMRATYVPLHSKSELRCSKHSFKDNSVGPFVGFCPP